MKSTLFLASLASLGASAVASDYAPPSDYPAPSEAAPSDYPAPSQTSCPAPGSTNADGQYSCNPAHQYPAGQTCELVEGCYYLKGESTTSDYPEPSQTSCAAPGSTNAEGQYSCNPAHQYPAGQTCELVEGCYVLVGGSTTAAYPEPTESSCAPPGSTNAEGQYSCNPAHSYPEGQICELVEGCYVLVGGSTTAPYPEPTNTACPAPGSTDAEGRYSCNPAHAYPEGQTCELIDDCYLLVGPKPSHTGSDAPYPTSACPAPGSTAANGDYSCNPAHQYPAGQTCVLVNGCYVLRHSGMSTSVVVPQPTHSGNNGTHPGVPTAVPAGAAGLKASMSAVVGLMAVVYFAL